MAPDCIRRIEFVNTLQGWPGEDSGMPPSRQRRLCLPHRQGGAIFDGALNSDILIDFLRRLNKSAGLEREELRVSSRYPSSCWMPVTKDPVVMTEFFGVICTVVPTS